MSEEAFNEIVEGFEHIRTLTEWGSKNIKYHIQKLQQENKNLTNQLKILMSKLDKYDEIVEENYDLKSNWNNLKKWLEKNWEESQDIWFVKIINQMQELEQGK